jgi:predicted transcriptional regulator
MLRTGDTNLGALESAVLEHLWKVGPADAKAVHHALGKGRGITLNTVQSAMKRLYEKRLLDRDKVSHAHIYRARLSRAELGKDAMSGIVQRLLRGEAAAMVATFVDLIEEAGDEHLDELSRLVSERRRERERTRKGAP